MKIQEQICLGVGIFIGGVLSFILGDYFDLAELDEDLLMVLLMLVFGFIGKMYASKNSNKK